MCIMSKGRTVARQREQKWNGPRKFANLVGHLLLNNMSNRLFHTIRLCPPTSTMYCLQLSSRGSTFACILYYTRPDARDRKWKSRIKKKPVRKSVRTHSKNVRICSSSSGSAARKWEQERERERGNNGRAQLNGVGGRLCTARAPPRPRERT